MLAFGWLLAYLRLDVSSPDRLSLETSVKVAAEVRAIDSQDARTSSFESNPFRRSSLNRRDGR
jgi:hypothetical protein